MDINSLTAMITEKTGISEDKAKIAVQLVLNQVKEKLPAPAQGYIDSMLGEEGEDSSLTSTVTQGLGSLLGG